VHRAGRSTTKIGGGILKIGVIEGDVRGVFVDSEVLLRFALPNAQAPGPYSSPHPQDIQTPHCIYNQANISSVHCKNAASLLPNTTARHNSTPDGALTPEATLTPVLRSDYTPPASTSELVVIHVAIGRCRSNSLETDIVWGLQALR
jgi:hypothetical protein